MEVEVPGPGTVTPRGASTGDRLSSERHEGGAVSGTGAVAAGWGVVSAMVLMLM